MWNILLILLPLFSVKTNALTEINVEFHRAGRHITNNQIHRFNIYKKKIETNKIIVTDNTDEMLQENLNRLFNPLIKNKKKLLSYKSITPKVCERYIFFTVQFGENSNKIKICESPYTESPMHKKIISWVKFLK